MTKIDTTCFIASQTTKNFWSGWLAASAIIAAGKFWTIITNPEIRVSEMVGHLGTPYVS